MNLTRVLYGLLCAVMLSSCSQWKALTSRDNSTVATKTPSKRTKSGDVKFIDGISVSPGNVVVSKHPMGPSMPNAGKRKKERDVYNSSTRTVANSGDIERVDWLQLKYAIVLDATVESLTNVGLLKTIDDWWGGEP